MLTVEDLNRNLLEEWTKSLEHLNREEKIALYNLGILVTNNGIDCLYDIHKSLAKHNQSMYILDGKLGYELQEDEFLLKIQDMNINLNYLQLNEIINGLIDILEEIYPLGTVVELKTEYLKRGLAIKDIETAQVMIIGRFIYQKDIKSYFQYAGVVYPLGLIGEGKVIQFTSKLIEKVIHKGFCDEKDNGYIYLMKKELIIDNKMHSFGFSSNDERSQYSNKIKEGGKFR